MLVGIEFTWVLASVKKRIGAQQRYYERLEAPVVFEVSLFGIDQGP